MGFSAVRRPIEQEWIAKDLPAAWERIDAVWGNAGFLHKLYFQLHWLQSERIFEIMEFVSFFPPVFKPTTHITP